MPRQERQLCRHWDDRPIIDSRMGQQNRALRFCCRKGHWGSGQEWMERCLAFHVFKGSPPGRAARKRASEMFPPRIFLPTFRLLKPNHLGTADETLMSEMGSGSASGQRFEASVFPACSCSDSSSSNFPTLREQDEDQEQEPAVATDGSGRHSRAHAGRLQPVAWSAPAQSADASSPHRPPLPVKHTVLLANIDPSVG